jgi:hypothetical protein
VIFDQFAVPVGIPTGHFAREAAISWKIPAAPRHQNGTFCTKCPARPAPVTVRYLRDWLELAQITKGAVFRRLIGTGFPPKKPTRPGREAKVRTIPDRIGARLSPAAVGNIFKSVAKFIKLGPEEIRAISGHSIRVGATQDLLALNIDLASVMQAGRWKSHRMPMRYGEHVMAGMGGMARAARAQGRERVPARSPAMPADESKTGGMI